MSKFTASIKIDAVTNLNSVSAKVSKSFYRMEQSAKKANAGFEKLQKSLGGIVKYSGIAVAAFGAFSFKAASDAEEIAAKFGTVFEAVAKDSEMVASRLAKSYGLAESSAKKLLGNTGDLLTGFGFTDDAALSMSEKVQQLAVDLASFSNVQGGASRVSASLTKALLGERESLKEVGIAISEADVEARIAQKGMSAFEGMTYRQAKAQVTLELAYEQSKKAIGDYARTSESAANQMRLMQQRLIELAEKFGTKIVMPIAEKILPALNNFIDSISNNMDAILKWGKILGIAAIAAAAFFGPIIVFNKVKALWGILMALKAVITATWGFNAALLASPITWIVLGVAALIAAIVLLVKNWDAVSDAVIRFASVVWEYIEPAISAIKDGFVGFGVAAWDSMKSIGKAIYNFAIAPMKTALTLMSKLPKVGDFAKDALAGLDKIETKVFGEADFSQNSKSQLDVNMRIDQDGRARVTGAQSSNNLNFSSQIGLMAPAY